MEYKILWCEGCNAVALTQENINCLHCDGAVKEIGFMDEIVQEIMKTEQEIYIDEETVKSWE